VSTVPPLFLTELIAARRMVTDFGAKARAMELMTHSDPDVRYRALLAVQQLVSHPWVTA